MAELARVTTGIGSLAVEEVGAGPAVILWPSLFCDRHLWRHQVAALSGRYRLLLVDPPGHGASGPPRGPFTLADCARAACEVLDACEVASAAWLGLSWGGMTALHAALDHPERVHALALLDTSAESEARWRRLLYRGLAAIYRRTGMTRFLAGQVRPFLAGRTTLSERPELLDEIFDHLSRCERQAILLAIAGVVLQRRPILARLPAITAPTLVVVGEEDRATPPPCARRIAAAIPGARLETVPASGHLSALEAPVAVNRLVGGFLDAVHATR